MPSRGTSFGDSMSPPSRRTIMSLHDRLGQGTVRRFPHSHSFRYAWHIALVGTLSLSVAATTPLRGARHDETWATPGCTIARRGFIPMTETCGTVDTFANVPAVPG